MSKKKKPSPGGLVYSTDPNFKLPGDSAPEQETPAPSEQKLKIRLATKHRAGKVVTLVQGFMGSTADAEELGKKLKVFCGTGGSVKDDEIIVQGDHRDKLLKWLQEKGYKSSKKI